MKCEERKEKGKYGVKRGGNVGFDSKLVFNVDLEGFDLIRGVIEERAAKQAVVQEEVVDDGNPDRKIIKRRKTNKSGKK